MSRVLALIAIVAATSACQKVDPEFCGKHPDDTRCAGGGGDGGVGGDGGGAVIGGAVTGLTGAGLVLENNGGDDKPVQSSGSFRFATPVMTGGMYDVTVSTQPTNPSQNCTVTNGAGTAASDVSNVSVDCAVAAYKIGGTALGVGGSVTIQNNGGDTLTISANGPFQFPTAVPSGTMYTVAISGTPGTCSVSGGTGTVGNADVNTVVLNCSATNFTIGGNVTGLNGQVTLKNNSNGDQVTISANGSYAFPMTVISGGAYDVSVQTQPAYPPAKQTCVVANHMGNAPGPVLNVDVSCTTDQFKVGGTIGGTNGNTVVLQNNGADNLSLTADGNFQFPTAIASGMSYQVGVFQTPPTLSCSVSRSGGTVGSSDVTNVAVNCGYRDPGVHCGTNTYCSGATGTCCDPEGSPSCKANSGSCGGAFSMACDSSEDCGFGNVCCASENGGHNKVDGVGCASFRNCGGRHLCDPNVPFECGGQQCKPYSLLPGYYTCQ